MVGQVVAIIDEMIYEVLVEVYPNKRFVFKSDMNFITPFVSCEALPFDKAFARRHKKVLQSN